MSNLRKALDNLEEVCPHFHFPGDQELLDESIKALRTELAQREQEPVGTYEGVMEAMLSLRNGTLEQQQVYGHMKDKLLYAAPQKREWVGLTDEDRSNLLTQHHGWNEFGRAIEAKLKEKTHDTRNAFNVFIRRSLRPNPAHRY